MSLGVVGHRHRAADRAARRDLVRAARGPRQRRDRPRDKPIRGLGPRLLDGHTADRPVRAPRCTGFQRQAIGLCSTTPAGWLRHIILPGLTVGLVAAAIMTRYIRSAVLEVAAMGYVRTARSKGLPPRVVTMRHTVRNAAIPILTITGIQLATILGGVIVVEVVFAWPGLGRLVYNAVAARDYPVIQGAVLLIAALFLLINLIVDMLYALVDPRIRLS